MTGTRKMDETKKTDTQTTQREQGQAGRFKHDEVGGRQREQGGLEKEREKSAIGGQPGAETGESDKSRTEKSRSEPTNR